MEPTSDVDNVLNHLEAVSGQGLRKRGDMATLLELALARDAHEEVNELAFHGSFLHQLFQTLRKSPPGGEGYKALEREFNEAVERVRQLLATLMQEASDEQLARFDEVYYQTTQGSLRNLVDLAHDLGVLKSVQNERKFRGAG